MRPRPSLYRSLLEAFFAINMAFAGLTIVFGTIPAASVPFAHLEVYINQTLGIRQTDFIRGYFEISIPSLLLALCIWSILRVLRRRTTTDKFLRSVAGGAIVLCPSAIWTCFYVRNGWSFDWPYRTVLGEPVLAIVCLWLFLNLPWAAARWVGTSAILAHCLFWYWFISSGFYALEWGIPGYGGPIGLIVGSCAVIAWGLYVREFRRWHVNAVAVSA